jgi:acetylxylan esterase
MDFALNQYRATMISAAIPGSSVEAIDYPALLSPYNISSYNGTQTTTTQLMNYVDKCNKARVVLLGYSQGAHVVGDVMCGGGESTSLGPNTPPIAQKYQDKVVAVIQMGDPRHLPMKPFDIGSSMKPGVSSLPIAWYLDSHWTDIPKTRKHLLRCHCAENTIVL